MDNEKYLKISDFTKIIKENIETSYPIVFLRGEISNFRPASSGHWYFSIKDESASIKAIIFKNSQPSILSLLTTANLQTLSDGQEVLVEGRISLYERSGEYSIIINKLIPVGIGELAVKFELLKGKLSKEGLFDEEIKKELPKYPLKIGIVTSPTAAALKDILNVLNRRFASLKIKLFSAGVQGENAKYEITNAIKFADYHYRTGGEHKVDVLILARGGGSIEDLWPFNEEMVAYSIYNAAIPIITGIGHQIDYTIADFCADLRAPTPSAAAEIVVRSSEELLNNIAGLSLRMEGAFNNSLEKLWLRYDKCNKTRITSLFETVYQNNLQDFAYLEDKMQNNFREYYTNIKNNFSFLTKQLDNLSPLKTLARGYSVTIDKNRKIIKSSENVELGDNLSIILSKGELSVTVDEVFSD